MTPTIHDRALELAWTLQKTDLINGNRAVKWLLDNPPDFGLCNLRTLDELCSALYTDYPNGKDMPNKDIACELREILMNVANSVRDNILERYGDTPSTIDSHYAECHIHKALRDIFSRILLVLKDAGVITQAQYDACCVDVNNHDMLTMQSRLDAAFEYSGAIKSQFKPAEALLRLARCNVEAMAQVRAIHHVVPICRHDRGWTCPACDQSIDEKNDTQTCPYCGTSLVWPKMQ